MLPLKIAKSRIFTYDWPAGVGRDAALASMFNHSSHLLSSLTVTRAETVHTCYQHHLLKAGTNFLQGTTTRPIIFVASCFGGLLLAKVLYKSFLWIFVSCLAHTF